MKLLRWGEPGKERPGILDANGQIRDLSPHIGDVDGAALGKASLERLRGIDPSGLEMVPADTRIGPCVAGVRNFLAIGLNYADHAREAGMPIPDEPVLFSKCVSSICGPNDPVRIPPGSEKTDWEVELAVVIGSAAYRLDERESENAIAGYCVCNDISERQDQLERGGQWIKGKSYPTFGPLGPWLVTPDEIHDVHSLSVWLELNGQKMQDSSTRFMIFNVPKIVSYLSHFMRLEPGDVITTGTPPGIGMALNPPRYLQDGDVLRCGIEKVGVQQQVCSEAVAQAGAA